MVLNLRLNRFVCAEMKVLLVHVDGKMPNPVLMKLSAEHKQQSDTVSFKRAGELSMFYVEPDKVYISCVFSWNKSKALGIAKMFPNAEVVLGGPGVDLSSKLPEEIEHIMPDYSLYNTDYSMGFTSRGCIRNCPWCIVPQKEGYIKDNALIDEFLKPGHKKLILLDNNFMASPRWKENIERIIAYRLWVSFTQGLDIRLIDRESAKLLRLTRWYNWTFKHRTLYFAFDLLEIEDEVRRGIKLLVDAGIKPDRLRFYILTNFNTTFNEDMHRFKVLRELGTEPFVMIYNKEKAPAILRHFSRWVNRMLYKSCEWKNYSRRTD